jgi:glycerol kinase
MQSQTQTRFGALHVDGGPSQNRFLMQTVADALAHPVIQSEAPEVSALGAAHLAGLSLGMWADVQAISALPRITTTIEPTGIDSLKRVEAWNDAIARSTFQPALDKGE